MNLSHIYLVTFSCILLAACVLQIHVRKAGGHQRLSETSSQWNFLVFGILALAIMLRLVEFIQDGFDFDEYAYMPYVQQNLLAYAAHFQGIVDFPSLLHYWVTYRFLGDSLTAFRTMPALSSVLFLIVMVAGIMRFWSSKALVNGFLAVALSIVAFNAQCLYLSRYAMFVYGNSLFVSAVLFFLFMQMAEKPLNRRWWFISWIVFGLLAFFSRVYVMVPIATGVILVFIHRWRDTRGRCTPQVMLSWLIEFAPFLVFPVVYAALQAFFPFTNLGAEKRPDMAHLFFPTSEFSSGVMGALRFTGVRTFDLFSDVLRLALPHSFRLLIGCSALILLAMIQVVRRRADSYTLFTALFLVISSAIMLFGGLLGLFPYGKARYAPFLVIPLATLAGYGASTLYEQLTKVKLVRTVQPVLLSLVAIAFLVTTGGMVARRYDVYQAAKQQRYELIAELGCRKEIIRPG